MTVREKLKQVIKNLKTHRIITIEWDKADFHSKNCWGFLDEVQKDMEKIFNNGVLDMEFSERHDYVKNGVKCIGISFK